MCLLTNVVVTCVVDVMLYFNTSFIFVLLYSYGHLKIHYKNVCKREINYDNNCKTKSRYSRQLCPKNGREWLLGFLLIPEYDNVYFV